MTVEQRLARLEALLAKQERAAPERAKDAPFFEELLWQQAGRDLVMMARAKRPPHLSMERLERVSWVLRAVLRDKRDPADEDPWAGMQRWVRSARALAATEGNLRVKEVSKAELLRLMLRVVQWG
jgi:hypothetical protein